MDKPASSFHINTFAPVATWLRLARENGGIAPKYWAKFFRILATSAAVSPLRLAEKIIYAKEVKNTPIPHAPIFICGFARSGTTHLHNLLAEDPNHGAITTLQALVPTFFLLSRGRLKRLMESQLTEETRPVDNVKVSLDMPQECELALANSTHMSLLYELSFSKLSRNFFERYGLMGDGSKLASGELQQWKKIYLDILKKATIHAGGKRLVLKSPPYLGRLPLLVNMFPNAKFIHIVRSPYRIYQSMLHLYQVLHSLNQLDDYNQEDVEEFLIESYVVLMQRYLQDRALIPKENLVELRFEDLEQDPMGELEKIYAGLDLPDWEQSKAAIQAYMGTLADYKKNAFTIEQSLIDRVEDKWRFALEHWHYETPEVGP